MHARCLGGESRKTSKWKPNRAKSMRPHLKKQNTNRRFGCMGQVVRYLASMHKAMEYPKPGDC
jgi:hypothetical protein